MSERQPLLGDPQTTRRYDQDHDNENENGSVHDNLTSKHLVDFDPNGDPENPREWPTAFKWTIVSLLACMAFTVTFTCISVVPVASQIVADLNQGHPDPSASALLVTIWELGEAAGPLLIAPLSEIHGRYRVLNTANLLFIAAAVLAATARSPLLFIASRCLTGLAVASNVLNPAIIGDLFDPDERGSAMSLVMLAPLVGGAVGPAISGAIAQTLGWRQVLWVGVGLAVGCELLLLTCFRETYKVSILRGRVGKLRREGHGDVFLAPSAGGGESVGLWQSVRRPVEVLFGSGVLMALSLYGSVSFSFFYTMSITLADILHDVYGFSPALTGSAFMSFSLGSFVAVGLCNAYLDRIYISLRSTRSKTGQGRPEFRLPLSILGGFALPFAVVAYGWIAQLALPAPWLLLAVALLGCTELLAFIPLSAYAVDAFGAYSASAMTGVIVTRCLMGTFLPLSVAPMVERFGGYGWTFTVLGGLSLVLAPVPVVVMRYGHRWRQASRFSRDVLES
ncbi:MFS general substrate transporter [Sodiomyces alkalinus F11]|uniref:MFS general substrate transporter n=1 Tax=Sodiomyces alkalinus (strain CBS 110278 / VKM F-3762 / F11) TaxID=1314773 RepID=A0A3N2PTI6_SODAK|nr:MFS general substrate transporter [Sodiomyces alkalinus F11]ROT37829.1 MFS general substrate transporter [Sodiomyces alkalinus F11]